MNQPIYGQPPYYWPTPTTPSSTPLPATALLELEDAGALPPQPASGKPSQPYFTGVNWRICSKQSWLLFAHQEEAATALAQTLCGILPLSEGEAKLHSYHYPFYLHAPQLIHEKEQVLAQLLLLLRKVPLEGCSTRQQRQRYLLKLFQQLQMSPLALALGNQLSDHQKMLVGTLAGVLSQGDLVVVDLLPYPLNEEEANIYSRICQLARNLGKSILTISRQSSLANTAASHVAVLQGGRLTYHFRWQSFLGNLAEADWVLLDERAVALAQALEALSPEIHCKVLGQLLFLRTSRSLFANDQQLIRLCREDGYQTKIVQLPEQNPGQSLLEVIIHHGH